MFNYSVPYKGSKELHERRTNMNRNQIMEVITELSYSQGFYGRLKRNMTDEALDYLEAQNFKDSLDLILFLEG
jgi:hypothetical protein